MNVCSSNINMEVDKLMIWFNKQKICTTAEETRKFEIGISDSQRNGNYSLEPPQEKLMKSQVTRCEAHEDRATRCEPVKIRPPEVKNEPPDVKLGRRRPQEVNPWCEPPDVKLRRRPPEVNL